MKTPSSLDRQTLQRLLASAFAVQESQIASQSLSDIMDVQRSIARGKLDLDGAMRHIVESARNVANATGVAIGLLEGDQLTYRAGSGTSAAYIGEHVRASLTVSANTKTSREILRVENAQTDTRIEADICRQFGANALLILPIYQNRALAGVLDILFSEAHAFQDCEVRTYRLMAEQIEAAMLQAAQLDQTKNLSAELPATTDAFEPITAPTDDFVPPPDFLMLPENEHSLYARCGALFAAITELPVFKQSALLATRITQRGKTLNGPSHRPTLTASRDLSSFFRRSGLLATTLTQRAKNLTWPKRWRSSTRSAARELSSIFKRAGLLATQRAKNLTWPRRWRNWPMASSRDLSSVFNRSALFATTLTQRAKTIPWPNRRRTLGLAAVAVALVVSALFAYRGRGPVQSLESSTLPNSSTIDPQAHLPKPLPGQGALVVQPAPGPSKEARLTGTALRRVRVGPHEVDYIGQDVTVRIFSDRPTIKRRSVRAARVAHIGDDVTVRYFTPLPTTTKTASR
jgi:GAF domain